VLDVVLVEDHEMVRAGLAAVLDADGALQVVGSFDRGEPFLDALRDGLHCDVCIVDLSLPGMGGAELIREATKRGEAPHFLVVTANTAPSVAVNALRCGARGYVGKGHSPAELIEAVKACAAGRPWIDAELVSDLVSPAVEDASASHDLLSTREFEVMVRLARGERPSRIATDLCLSPKTVSTYRQRVLDKLGVDSNAELTVYCIRRGIIDG